MDVSLWPEMTGDNRGCERMQRTPSHSHIRQNMPSTKWIHYDSLIKRTGIPKEHKIAILYLSTDVLYLGNWSHHIAILDLFASEISKLIWNRIPSIIEQHVILRGMLIRWRWVIIGLNICSATMINGHLIFVMGISSLSAAILGTAPHNTPEMQGKFPESLAV